MQGTLRVRGSARQPAVLLRHLVSRSRHGPHLEIFRLTGSFSQHRRAVHRVPAAAAPTSVTSDAPGSSNCGSPSLPPKRYAVVGAGFAGVAVAWHLLSRASHSNPISLHLYDAYGLGAGGSGAAAGLLHPYTTRGKVLWRGLEAFQAALELVQAAEAAANELAAGQGEEGCMQGGAAACFTWRDGILRPARSHKQGRELHKFVPQDAATAAATGAELVDCQALQQLVPGMPVDTLIPPEEEPRGVGTPAPMPQQRKQQRQQQRREQQGGEGLQGALAAPAPEAAGLLVRQAVVLDPLRYLQAAWAACGQLAQRAGQGSEARLVIRAVPSLRRLEEEDGPFDAVVVAAGAAVGVIEELQGLLPIQLCQGYTLVMEPPGAAGAAQQEAAQPPPGAQLAGGGGGGWGRSGYPPSAPSLLGPPYISARGPTSLIVGATKRYGLSGEEALQECGRGQVECEAERAEAVGALLPAAGELWPPVQDWQVVQVKSGVRALPARGKEGSIPFAGKVPSSPRSTCAVTTGSPAHAGDGNYWFVGGLGARGLVYHAWLGKVVAEAVVRGDEGVLPPELLRWREEPSGS